MEDAPTPLNNDGKLEEFFGFVPYQDDIYQVDFKIMNKAIMIKCHNTNDRNNHNEEYSYKLTEDEIIKVCGNYSIFISKLKENASEYLELEKLNNSFSLKILLGKHIQTQSLILPLKVFNEEDVIDEDNINNLQDAIKVIKLMKKKLDTVQKNFEDYKAKMELNFLYNSFDSEAYKLEDLYNNLPSKHILQNKSDFCLINKGIQHLFQKSIVFFECIYKSENLKFEYEKFYEMFQNSEYSILIILTQDNKRFGSFFKRNVKNDNNDNIEINNLNNQQYPNNMGIYNLNKKQRIKMNKSHNYFGQGNPFVQNNNINNPNDTNIIFNSYLSEKDYYVFSLDSSEIFYSNNNLGNNIIPSFSIELSGRILIVKENPLNSIGFMLNGTQKSNFMEIELYSIQYGAL